MAEITRVNLSQRLNGYVRAKVEGDGFYPVVEARLGRVQAPVEWQQGSFGGVSEVMLLLPRTQIIADNPLVLMYVDVNARMIRSVHHLLSVDEEPQRGPRGARGRPRRGGLSTSPVGRALAVSTVARK